MSAPGRAGVSGRLLPQHDGCLRIAAAMSCDRRRPARHVGCDSRETTVAVVGVVVVIVVVSSR